MARIVILGSGVMGSAIAVPPAQHSDNQVTLVGSPLDDDIIRSIQSSRFHPTLKLDIPTNIQALKLSELNNQSLLDADVVVIGVSSPGIEWVVQFLRASGARPGILALVTKGLVENPQPGSAPLTYADALSEQLTNPPGRIVGIGGPCIARELALRVPTRVTYASSDIRHAQKLRSVFESDFYHITTHSNIVAVEACAALKNFLCIGVSAMLTAYPLEDSHAKNPLAALFNQAVLELLILSRWISDYSSARTVESATSSQESFRPSAGDSTTHGQANGNAPGAYPDTRSDVAFDLAGMGDLHVTVGGGRNSRLGAHLGNGSLLADVLDSTMSGVTVEGVDTGRRLNGAFRTACADGDLSENALPLTRAILDTIVNDSPFQFDFSTLPG